MQKLDERNYPPENSEYISRFHGLWRSRRRVLPLRASRYELTPASGSRVGTSCGSNVLSFGRGHQRAAHVDSGFPCITGYKAPGAGGIPDFDARPKECC